MASMDRLVKAVAPKPPMTPDELVKYCEAVASASGGLLGLHRVSADERALLTTIAAEFKKQNQP